jgi:uncharacterized protein (DUF2384 family)
MNALEVTEKELFDGARAGISKSRLLAIAKESGLTIKEFSSYIQISTRSIQLKEPSELIAPGPSEKALFIAKLFDHGSQVFGSKEKFRDWLNSENQVLNGFKPRYYLDTFSGILLVIDELNAIEYGFPA